MTRNEKQLQYLYDKGIALDYFPLNNLDAFCVDLGNDNNRICLNSNKKYSSISEFWMIEHELSHLEQKALYNLNSSALTIKKYERKANDKMILKFDLPNKILELLKIGYSSNDIKEYLEITENVFESCIDYLLRKGKL